MKTKSVKYHSYENQHILLQLLAILLISRLFMLIMVPVYNGIMGTDRTFSFLMNEWDAKRYQFMVDNGYTFPWDYDPQANWAFFPMYVLVCAAVKAVTFWKADTYYVGMLVSNVCIYVAAFTTVRYIKDITSDGSYGDTLKNLTGKKILGGICSKDVLLVGFLMFAAPYTFYCSSMYTEAMFIMFISLFFYFCNRKKFLTAGIMAAFASGTRIVGCTLVFPLIIEMYRYYQPGRFSFAGVKEFIVKVIQKPVDLLSILVCPLGTFTYMAFLRVFCGDVWAFLHVQIAWREDEYFPVLGVMWKACTGQIEPRYTYMGWFCVGVFVMYGYMLAKTHYSMAIFGIISLLVPLASHVMSTCRFTIGSYVIFIGFYDLLGRMRGSRAKDILRWIIIAVFIALETLLLFMWYNSDCWLM